MAVAQLSLFPITATGSLPLLLRVLTAPHGIMLTWLSLTLMGTVHRSCREGSTDLLRQTTLIQLLPTTQPTLSPATPYTLHVHPPLPPQARNPLSILPRSLHPAVTTLGRPAPEPKHLLHCSQAPRCCRVSWYPRPPPKPCLSSPRGQGRT